MAQGLRIHDVPGCPWYGWDMPNVEWCEAILCGWVTTPANTWSNLAFLVVGYLIHRRLAARSLKRAASRDSLLTLMIPAVIATGLTSFFFHASSTRFFQLFDFAGMYTMTCLSMAINYRRQIPTTSVASTKRLYAVLLVASLVSIPVFELVLHLPIQATVLVSIIAQLLQELRLALSPGKRQLSGVKYAEFGKALGFLLIAGACSAADLKRVWCDPDDHLVQGHAAWHVFSAISLYFQFLFYESIERIDDTGTPLG